ncbi:MAG TPA: hypothetical protein VIM86_09305 [Thermodesulfobacteriota bacterium]
MYLTIQLSRYDFGEGRRVRQPPYVTLDGAACERFAHLAAAAGLFVPSGGQPRFYADLRAAAAERDPDSDGPADSPPDRPSGVRWRDYNRLIDEWRTTTGLHNGERAFLLDAAQVARLAAGLAAPDLAERLVETARAAGVTPLPTAREVRATVSSVLDRIRPMVETAAARGQGIWIAEST